MCFAVATERDATYGAGLPASRSKSGVGATFAALTLTCCDRQFLKSAPREECREAKLRIIHVPAIRFDQGPNGFPYPQADKGVNGDVIWLAKRARDREPNPGHALSSGLRHEYERANEERADPNSNFTAGLGKARDRLGRDQGA
ncbi:hypothetical protein GCM10010833_02690 [Blastomonas aquatica]|uniref:Uncharacterized protein n=1 Tax=Blastomonas aquatica TaxID=1510276 RepID=A0ABQ1ISN0_9SPHN|nr:hypothetical protein GCM10010833_02690 [Blastomonas aquatica]